MYNTVLNVQYYTMKITSKNSVLSLAYEVIVGNPEENSSLL